MENMTREQKIELVKQKQKAEVKALPREKKIELVNNIKNNQPEHDDILGVPVSTVEGVLDSLYLGGAIFGGALGTGVAPGPGTVAGAAIGAGVGESVANFARTALDMDSRPETSKELWTRPVEKGIEGAAAEMGGQVLSKIPGAIKKIPDAIRSGTRMIKGQPPVPVQVIPKGKVFKDVGFEQTMKPNAKEIQAATQRISGSKATPGMVSSNQNIQNVENVIAQSPTLAGEKVRKAYQPIQKGLGKYADDLAGSPTTTPFEAGEQFKQGAISKISEKVKPLSSRFEKVREASRHIKPNQKSLNKSADRLLKQDMAEFKDLPQGQAIRKYAGMIRDAKTLESLKQLRSSVGDEITAAINSGNGQMARALGKVKGSIQRLERREIIKSAIEAMPTKTQGQAAAKELIGDLKSVNKGWRSLMTELEAIAKAGGIRRIHSPKHLAKLIEDMPSEKLTKQFFNTKNYKGLRDIKKYLPDEFELLRQNKLGEIAERSLVRGEIDPVKLVKNLKNIGKESREILFGKSGEKILKDMETIIHSMPKKVGTSDTPRGISWFTAVFKPSNYNNEVQSAYSYMRLTGRISSKKVGQKTINLGQKTSQIIPRAAGYAAAGALSKGDKKRGQDKWADQGLKKIQGASGGKFSNIKDVDLQKSPKLKRLLIRASKLKPNSKAMNKVIEQIEKEFGGKK